MKNRYDIVVIGTGIAGLFYALEVAEKNRHVKIMVVTKKTESESSTNRAQGGIAAVLSKTDSFDSHIADTLEVGCGVCRPEVVKTVVEAGPEAIRKLVDYGVRFTRSGKELDLGREAAHSVNRVVHADDLTGKEIERALLAACGMHGDRIRILQNHIVVDLITYKSEGRDYCGGAYVFDDVAEKIVPFYAPVTLLATGGLGQVYFHTSNPKIATGDGVAIAYRAGVSVANLEFIQFHPTTLYSPGRAPFLISEAVRGEGGRLLSVDGRLLMEHVHKLKDLAPRDVVARAIDRELKESGEEYVYLDVSFLDADFLRERFPNIHKACLRFGFDITRRPIPVVPAAHYSCGGIVADIDGRTELPGLYSCGETAMTGMHGANRLASNSLLEAVVTAQLSAASSLDYYSQSDLPESIPVDDTLFASPRNQKEKILIAHDRHELSRVMSDFVGIVRTGERLELALEKVRQIRQGIEAHYFAIPPTYEVLELRNLATVAELIIRCAIKRKTSIGLHFLEDQKPGQLGSTEDTIIPGRLAEGVPA